MPDSDYLRLPLQTNLTRSARTRALEQIQQTGRALPSCVTAVNGSMVTVKFEVSGPWTLPQITIPKAESQWLRAPTQVGDFGMTTPAHTSLGGISGLGDGVADLTVDYGNMTTLVWVPCAAVSFPTAPDPDKAYVNGPAGTFISDTAQTATMVTAENLITHTAGVGTANEVKTIVDGAGNAISHVVSSGGLIGMGALASSLGAARAVPAQADITTLVNNIIGTTIQTTITQLLDVFVAQGVPSTAAVAAIVQATGWVKNLPGILPTIPSCSSILRVAP